MSAERAAVADLESDRRNAFLLTPVSRETQVRLEKFVALLLERQKTINLIANSTISTLWTRHIADSLQLLDLAPHALVWVDLGSGGGFPGFALACSLADRPNSEIHLIESTGKKAAFLRDAAAAIGLPAKVHHMRIENIGDSLGKRVDVVTARALAPLKTVLDQAYPLMGPKTLGLFHKGRDVEAELTEASKYWNIEADLVQSRTHPDGRIVVVRHLEPRKGVRKQQRAGCET